MMSFVISVRDVNVTRSGKVCTVKKHLYLDIKINIFYLVYTTRELLVQTSQFFVDLLWLSRHSMTSNVTRTSFDS